MSLTASQSHPSFATAVYTVWLEHREKGKAPAFTVREQATKAIAYGPTDNSVAATRACMRLNDGTMVPNKSHGRGQK